MLLNELTESDKRYHSYLEPSDEILYWGEYFPDEGYDNAVKSLILNLKKPLDKKGTYEWRYKTQAINNVADHVAAVMNDNTTKRYIWVPIPPSKIRTDPMFDNRVFEILEKAQTLCNNSHHYIVDMFEQTENREASSTALHRPNIDELKALYTLTLSINDYNPEQDIFIIFDDMITTGCHFKVVQQLILDKYPSAHIGGVFIARRAIRNA